jgi:O-antigen/teichoic acid export membrane protein
VRDLVKGTVVTWLGAGALLLAALVRGKVFALSLGTAGVGIVAQLSGFTALAGSIGSLSLGSAVAQQVARFRGLGAQDDARRVIQTATFVSGALGVLLSAAAWVAAPSLSRWLFAGDGSYAWAVRLVALGIAFFSVGPNLQSVFFGYGAALYSSLADVATAVLTVLLVVALVPRFGVTGAVVTLVAIAAGRSIAQTVGISRREPRAFSRFPSAVDRRALREILPMLLAIAAASVVMATTDSGAQLFIRTRIIRWYGVEENGLYQAAFAASSQVLVNGMSFVAAIAFARVNSAPTRPLRWQTTNEAFRLALIITTVGTCALIALRDPYIHLLLSRQFLPARQYFPLQAAGEAIKQLSMTAGLALLTTAGVIPWLGVGLLWSLVNVAGAVFLLPLGRWAVPLPYFIGAVTHFAVSWWAMIHFDGFRMSRLNALLLAGSAAVVVAMVGLPEGTAGAFARVALMAGWLWFAVGEFRGPLRQYLTSRAGMVRGYLRSTVRRRP